MTLTREQMYEPPVSVGKAAEMLGISRSALRRAVERGELKRKGVTPGRGEGVGGHWRFERAELARYYKVLHPDGDPAVPDLRVLPNG